MFTLNGDIVTVTTPSDCRWLQVEFDPHGGRGGDGGGDKLKIKVPATGNMVSHVFFHIIASFKHHVVSVSMSTGPKNVLKVDHFGNLEFWEKFCWFLSSFRIV